ncbi:MAG: hypothetical protein WCN98_01415 [Verrucomicrobiaceae bacterium]
MNMMNILRGTSVALAIGFTATAAHAQAADDFRIDDAWKAALEGNEGILTEKQQAVVTGIAYAAAAALLCDGIDIDADKVAAATTAVLAEGPKGLTDEEQFGRYTNIMLMMGTAKGILLAEGALHKADFCAAATAAKTDVQSANFWK